MKTPMRRTRTTLAAKLRTTNTPSLRHRHVSDHSVTIFPNSDMNLPPQRPS
jgi:hypothetical protein